MTEEIDAGAELTREFDKYRSVKAAFWLKTSDEEQRYLYIASDQINDTNLGVAYGEMLRVANQMQSPYLDPFRVKLICGDDPLAQAAVDIHERFPSPRASRFGGTSFGGLSVDDVYVYPYPSPLPTAVT